MRKIAPLLALVAMATPASADVHALGPVSFAVPEGMTYTEENGSGTMARVDGQNFVAVAITLPQPSVGDADANFKALWTKIAQTAPPLAYSLSPKGGYGGKYGAASCKPKMNCLLFTLETGKGVVPVFAVTPEGQPDWTFFWPIHQSVRLQPARAQMPKKNLNLADLVGKWKWGAAATTAYVSRSSGMVVGTSTNAAGSTYTIAADGSYTVSSSGVVGSRTWSEQSAGRVELTADAVVFHQKDGDRRYRFLTYVDTVDGSTVLTLLNATYEPTAPNISLYAEDFVRAAP